MGNSSISEAHKQLPFPLSCSHISGNPPMPSNRLAIVASLSYWAQRRFRTHFQDGMAMEFPRALYLGLSLSSCFRPLLSTHSPMLVQPSGNPCNRSHSTGVNRRTIQRMIFFATNGPECDPSFLQVRDAVLSPVTAPLYASTATEVFSAIRNSLPLPMFPDFAFNVEHFSLSL